MLNRSETRMRRARGVPYVVRRARRMRVRPWPIQFDYLHLRRLSEDIRAAIGALSTSPGDVLDVWCEVGPYRELLPPSARVVGIDLTDPYGAVDVVSDEFLPFPDESF